MSHQRRLVANLVEADHRIRYAPGSGDVLVISFASIGQKRREMPNDEFVSAAFAQAGAHCLFVSDIRRRWLNAPGIIDDLRRAVANLREHDGVRRVVTIGSSMGAFSAIALAHHIDVDSTVAFSPQFSPYPDEVIAETRWHYWRKRLPSPLVRSLETFPDRGQFHIFHGVPIDADHVERFPRAPNIDHYLFDGVGHSELAIRFHEAGWLADTLRAAITGDREGVADIVRTLGGMPRPPR